MAGRKQEIESIITRGAARGWRSLFLTVTLSHHVRSSLAELLKGITQSWRFVFSGDRSGERAPLERVMAQIKTVEVRFGRNGWHPHAHVLLFVDESGMSEAEAAAFEDALAECIFSRYARKAEKLGMTAEREGYNWRPVSSSSAAAHYVTKLEASLELTGGEDKDSRSASRSYSAFQLLALYERGTASVYGRDIAELYREYAASTKGKRQVSYSREIKALLGIEQQPDEVLADELEQQPDERVLAVVPAHLWRVVCQRQLRAALLDIADSGDELRVSAWLDGLEESLYESPQVNEKLLEVTR